MVRGARRGDTGAVLLEAAISLLVIVALVVGVSVVSASLGAATTLDRLAGRAVRLAGSARDPLPSDLEVLALMAGVESAEVFERLVIYRPLGPHGGVPSACRSLQPEGVAPSGVAGWCTAYGPGHLEGLEAAPPWARGCGPESWERAWCPAMRRAVQDAGPQVGVLVEFRVRPQVPRGDETSIVAARAVAALDPVMGERP